MFKAIKNTYKKSEAAVIVQNLLEMQYNAGIFTEDPHKSANTLIQSAWDKNPHLYDGRFGQRPHKLPFAIHALANAISVLGINNTNSNCFSICLANALNEALVNGELYPFNTLDQKLLNEAATIMQRQAEEFEQSDLGKEMNKLMGTGSKLTWDDWYAEYKDEAGKYHEALTVDEKDLSLIDFMDDEPINRAFTNGVEPRQLGRSFAKQFDPFKMGIK
jgi:hypothetical protein